MFLGFIQNALRHNYKLQYESFALAQYATEVLRLSTTTNL